MARLLIVDDEQSICWGLTRLAQKMGHEAATASSAEEALQMLDAARPDTIVLDVRLPGMDGLAAMARFRERLGDVPIVVVTAFGELTTAVAAVRNGAFDYLNKPFNLEVAQRTIERALESRRIATPARSAEVPRDLQLIGSSAPMQEVFKRIALVAASDACVHLRGESGTGKELAARAIHRYGRRADGPYVAVNIASLSPSLAESELFGHVRGAFTGADQARRGLLEQADGGTIFLDEVADIPMPLQVKLLRALEHGEVLPVGAERPVLADFRIVSATNRNLAECVAQGTFRHDLYFRLITFEIDLPPLRRRREDIAPLVDYFLDRLASQTGATRPVLSEETLAELHRRPWYGNVRELRNAVEHAMILARGGVIAPDHLPAPTPPSVSAGLVQEDTLASLVRQWAESQLHGTSDPGDLYDQLMKIVEPPLFAAALEASGNQYATAARKLGIHRATLRKKVEGGGE